MNLRERLPLWLTAYPRTSRRNAATSPIEDTAIYISVSTQTIRWHIDSGKLSAYRFGPKLVRIQQADLDAMMRWIPAVGQ